MLIGHDLYTKSAHIYKTVSSNGGRLLTNSHTFDIPYKQTEPDAKGADLRPLTPLQGLVDAERQGALDPVKMLEQQLQQDLRYLERRQGHPFEHVTIKGLVAVSAQSHHPQR